MIVATVDVDDHRVDLRDGESVSIGRRADAELNIVGLDPDDRGVSRLAATVEARGTDVVVTNTSSAVNVYIDRGPGEPLVLRPGERFLVSDRCAVELRGIIRYHRVVVTARVRTIAAPVPVAGPQTIRLDLELSKRDRDALAALFRGYLEAFPRRDCVPATYEEAGKALGVPASTVRRRIDRVRERLAAQGVYIEGRNAREQLADFLLDNELIDPNDLRRLG